MKTTKRQGARAFVGPAPPPAWIQSGTKDSIGLIPNTERGSNDCESRRSGPWVSVVTAQWAPTDTDLDELGELGVGGLVESQRGDGDETGGHGADIGPGGCHPRAAPNGW